MGDVINLRSARKVKARATAAKTADANRVLHGARKIEKARAADEQARRDRLLNGARIEDSSD